MMPPTIPAASVGDTLTDARIGKVVRVTGHTKTGWPSRAGRGLPTPIVTAELLAWLDSEPSQTVIAAHLGVTTDWVSRVRKSGPCSRACGICGSTFVAVRRSHKYCGEACSAQAHASKINAANARTSKAAGYGLDTHANKLGVSRRQLVACLAKLLARLPLSRGDMDRLRIGLDD